MIEIVVRLIIGIIIAVTALWLHARLKGPSISFDYIEVGMLRLLGRGYDGGSTTIYTPDRKKSLVLRKYINGPGEYGIRLEFPQVEWTEPYFNSFCNICDKMGESFSIEGEGTKESATLLVVDFGKDPERAHQLVKEILTEVFVVNEKEILPIKEKNLCETNECINK